MTKSESIKTAALESIGRQECSKDCDAQGIVCAPRHARAALKSAAKAQAEEGEALAAIRSAPVEPTIPRCPQCSCVYALRCTGCAPMETIETLADDGKLTDILAAFMTAPLGTYFGRIDATRLLERIDAYRAKHREGGK